MKGDNHFITVPPHNLSKESVEKGNMKIKASSFHYCDPYFPTLMQVSFDFDTKLNSLSCKGKYMGTEARASAENFPGKGATEKRPKNSKKRPKNSTIKPLPVGEGQRKKDRKIALLSLYLLYLYHHLLCIKTQGGHGPSLSPAADAHALRVLHSPFWTLTF